MLGPNKAHIYRLASWQLEFVQKFISTSSARSQLIAAAGTGKTVTALYAANQMLTKGLVDEIVVVTDRIGISDHWRRIASERLGVELSTSLDVSNRKGLATTVGALTSGAGLQWLAGSEERRLLVIIDEVHRGEQVAELLDRLVVLNSENKALYIGRESSPSLSFESEFTFPMEAFFGAEVIAEPSTSARIARFAPSFGLLHNVENRLKLLDDLSWREFEKLIAGLLEKDGYSVQLMRGTKDGGVDIIAEKDLGPAGQFRSLWQAKKTTNKVGLSVVRELADTRQELDASKAIIVTSSFLTRGALDRVERDKFLLGKVDRKDLDTWMHNTLLGGS